MGANAEKETEPINSLKQAKIADFLRGTGEDITVRFDHNNVIRLSCHCDYDPALKGDRSNQVDLLRKVELQKPDGSWETYPSATWLDGVGGHEQLVTKALVRISGEKAISVMQSTQGVPDGTLMVAAEKAGVYTETIDGEKEDVAE